MGPRRWGGGKERRSDQGEEAREIQWSGEGRGVEKTATPRRVTPRTVSFNGATTLGSWKSRAWPSGIPFSRALQWGHDAGVVEKRHSADHQAGLSTRFNGATTLGSWKRIVLPT